MVELFPTGKLPNGHIATHNNKRMEVEGPNDSTHKGIEAKHYLVYDAESGTKGYVYYHADSQEFIGTAGPSGIMVLDSNSKMVSPSM